MKSELQNLKKKEIELQAKASGYTIAEFIRTTLLSYERFMVIPQARMISHTLGEVYRILSEIQKSSPEQGLRLEIELSDLIKQIYEVLK